MLKYHKKVATLGFLAWEVCVFWQKFWFIKQFVRCWLLTELSGKGWNQIGIFPTRGCTTTNLWRPNLSPNFGVRKNYHQFFAIKFHLFLRQHCLTQMQKWKVDLFCLCRAFQQLTFKNLADCFFPPSKTC